MRQSHHLIGEIAVRLPQILKFTVFVAQRIFQIFSSLFGGAVVKVQRQKVLVSFGELIFRAAARAKAASSCAASCAVSDLPLLELPRCVRPEQPTARDRVRSSCARARSAVAALSASSLASRALSAEFRSSDFSSDEMALSRWAKSFARGTRVRLPARWPVAPPPSCARPARSGCRVAREASMKDRYPAPPLVGLRPASHGAHSMRRAVSRVVACYLGHPGDLMVNAALRPSAPGAQSLGNSGSAAGGNLPSGCGA